MSENSMKYRKRNPQIKLSILTVKFNMFLRFSYWGNYYIFTVYQFTSSNFNILFLFEKVKNRKKLAGQRNAKQILNMFNRFSRGRWELFTILVHGDGNPQKKMADSDDNFCSYMREMCTEKIEPYLNQGQRKSRFPLNLTNVQTDGHK